MFHLICQLRNSLLCKAVSKSSKNNFSRLNRNKFKNKGIQVSNPGIENRLKIFNNTPNTHHAEELDLDAMESDFMKAGEVYRKYEREEQDHKEKTQLKMVKRRYFKTDVQPNFLTWAEKEQIRYLYDSDSLEWSPEKLSESFPAPENIIKKIIKSRWKPVDASQIVKHDQSVQSNWKFLTEGKLKIDSHLKEHLLKFGKRDRVIFAPPNSVHLKDSEITYPRKTEFLNIIESYKRIVEPCDSSSNTKPITLPDSQQMAKTVPIANHTKEAQMSDTYTLDGSKSKNKDAHFTLTHYRSTFNSITQDACNRTEASVVPNDKAFETATVNNTNTNNYGQNKRRRNWIDADNGNLNILDKENSTNRIFVEKISIPKNKWILGGTYKVEECYYDDDGEFLYRVPGMK